MEERVIQLEGEFDSAAFCRIRELLRSAADTARIVLDFHAVRCCQPFALAELFQFMGTSQGRVRARALTRQHEVLLGYLGARP